MLLLLLFPPLQMSDPFEPLRILAALVGIPLMWAYVRDDSITRLKDRPHLIRTLLLLCIFVLLQFP